MENYHTDYLGKKELDIYLQDYNLAIEYDGKNWHKSIENDLKKDFICKKNNIQIIRIREIGCPRYNSNSLKYEVHEGNLKDLENAIKFIFNYINTNYNKNYKTEIDIEKNRTKIYEIMELQEKNNSILNKCPKILEYWDSSMNGLIKPEQISYSSIKPFYLTCSKGHKWKTNAQSFIKSPNCPICSHHRILVGYNDLKTVNPKLALEFDLEKNNGKTAEDYMANSGKKVWWKCSKCNYEWEAKIIKRNKGGNRCPKCKNII